MGAAKAKKDGKAKTTTGKGAKDDAGAKALASLDRKLASIHESDLHRVSVDVDSALNAAGAVARFVSTAKVRARFAALPKAEFDVAVVDDLPTLVLATRYAHQSLRSAAAPASEAKVPYHLVEVGTQIKARMLRLCEYHFEDDVKYGPIVADIRDGTGYLDLASDLERLAKIYEDEYDLVDKDLRNYQPTDKDDARKYASDIREALESAVGGEQKKWQDTLMRAWTLLVEDYTEVRETGLWLFRRSIDRGEKFPSIFAAGRSGKHTGAKKKAAGGAKGNGDASAPAAQMKR